MFDEIDLLKAVAPEPTGDDGAKVRARARLLEAIAREESLSAKTSSRRPRVWWLAAAAMIAVVMVTISFLLPSHEGGPAASAAQSLNAVAKVAARQPITRLGPGQYAYSKESYVLSSSQTSVDTGSSYTVQIQGTQQT